MSKTPSTTTPAADPLVTELAAFETIVNALRGIPDSWDDDQSLHANRMRVLKAAAALVGFDIRKA